MGVLKLTWHPEAEDVTGRQVDGPQTPWVQIEIDSEQLDAAENPSWVFGSAAELLGRQMHPLISDPISEKIEGKA